MRRDVFVYISGPMTANEHKTIEEHVAAGVRAHLELLKAGIPNFCPHLSGIYPTAWTALRHEEWIAYDLAVIDRCTHMVMIDGWEQSKGARAEFQYALTRRMPIAMGVAELVRMVNSGEGN